MDSRSTRFKVTRQVLYYLRSERVPVEVLEKLEELRDREAMEERAFVELLQATLGEEATRRFRVLILRYAQQEGREKTGFRESWRNLKRLVRVYLLSYWSRLVVVLVLAMLTSLSPYVFGYLSRIMVDDVIQIGRGGGDRREEVSREGDSAGNVEGGSEKEGAADSSMEEDASSESSLGSGEGGDVSEGGSSKPSRGEGVRLLGILFGVYVLVRLIFAGASWLYSYTMTYVGQRIVFHLRGDLHDKLQQLQLSYFDQQQTGKVMARVFDDVAIVQSSVSGVFITLLTQIGMLIVGTLVVFRLNVVLALIAYVTFPFYIITYETYRRKIRPVNNLWRELNSEVYSIVSQAISNIRVVKSFAQEQREIRRFFHKAAQLIRIIIRHTLIGNTLGSVSSIISVIGKKYKKCCGR